MPFLIIIPVILIIILIVYLKHPSTRGKYGENKVRRVIGETVENEQYVINDLILVNEEKSSQIDHIVINPHGIFVLETKNYSGEIYGSESQREWTQVLAYGKVKNKLYNPLKQNATHVYNVKKIVVLVKADGMAIGIVDYNLGSARPCPGRRRGCAYPGGAVQLRIQQ